LANYVSDVKGIFTPYFGPTPFDFIGRTAQWYDTTFYVEDIDTAIGDPNGYRVMSGKIDVKFNIKENYFLGMEQTPTFSVQGYTVTGEIENIFWARVMRFERRRRYTRRAKRVLVAESGS
jgi:hypothetical protein